MTSSWLTWIRDDAIRFSAGGGESRREDRRASRRAPRPLAAATTWQFPRRERSCAAPTVLGDHCRPDEGLPMTTTTHEQDTGLLRRRMPTLLAIAATAASLALIAPLPERVQTSVSAWTLLLAAVIYFTWGTVRGDLAFR